MTQTLSDVYLEHNMVYDSDKIDIVRNFIRDNFKRDFAVKLLYMERIGYVPFVFCTCT